MAYQIEYDKNRVITIRKDFKKELLYGLLLVFTLVTGMIVTHFGGAFLQKIILGDKQQTHVATEQLVVDIQSGIPIQDAVQTFYAELTQ